MNPDGQNLDQHCPIGLMDVIGHGFSAAVSPQPAICEVLEPANRIVVIDKYCRLTYRELMILSRSFCDMLTEAGVQPFDPVAIMLENSRAFVVAALGVWTRGAVLVPLNPQLHESELLIYLRDTRARAIITTDRREQTVHALRTNGAQIKHTWLWSSRDDRWTYDASSVANSLQMTEIPSRATAEADRPAIIQYSTGSTGYPKRVTRSHGQLFGEFLSVSRLLKVTHEDRILGVAPFFHSHGLMNSALLALLSGATLYAIDTFLPTEIAALIERDELTGFAGVPFMFRLLSDLDEHYDLASLRFALSAGAPLPRETALAFDRAYGIKIRRLYGTTETGVISISEEHAGIDNVNSVGPPISGVSTEIVDEGGQCVPTETEGLVRVTSPFSALRYDNTLERSESYFREGQFFPGDLGRMSPTGEIILCGRHRGFINVNGYKVDPSEIEAVLRELPGVTDAVVLGVTDGSAEEIIKAVLVSERPGSPEEVRVHCVRRLAAFKCPRIIEFRKELPRNPLGKVLRKYLVGDAPLR